MLSPSTRYFDQSEKFRLYRTIASLQDYVMVSQDRMSIELYRRQSGKHWLFEEIAGSDGVLEPDSIGCSIPFSEIYARVDLDSPASS